MRMLLGFWVYVQHPLLSASDSFPVGHAVFAHACTRICAHTCAPARKPGACLQASPCRSLCQAGCHLPLGLALERSWEQPASPWLSSSTGHCWRLWGFEGHHAASECHWPAFMLGGGGTPIAQAPPHLLMPAPGFPCPSCCQRWVPRTKGALPTPLLAQRWVWWPGPPLPVAVWPQRKHSTWW